MDMKDRFASFFCGLCLVLCFIVVVSWARSSVSSEGMTIRRRYSVLSLAASEGTFVLVRGKLIFDSPEVEQAWRAAIDPEKIYNWDRWRFTWARDLGMMGAPGGSTFGFGYDASVSDATRRVMMPGIRWHRTIIQIPHWFVITLLGVGPGFWMYRRHRVRRERLSRGLCRKCGFQMGDLYHSCPRCGERAPLPDGFPVIDPH
jgi:hypothetical protein